MHGRVSPEVGRDLFRVAAQTVGTLVVAGGWRREGCLVVGSLRQSVQNVQCLVSHVSQVVQVFLGPIHPKEPLRRASCNISILHLVIYIAQIFVLSVHYLN